MEWAWQINAIVTAAVTLLLVILFLLRREVEPIKSRGWPLILFSVFFVVFRVIINAQVYTYGDTTPCFIAVLDNGITVPLAVLPNVIRGFIACFNYFLHEEHTYRRLGQKSLGFFTRNKWATTTRFWILLLVICAVVQLTFSFVFVYAVGSDKPEYTSAQNCFMRSLPVSAVASVIVFILGVISCFLLTRVSDAFYIREELLALLATVAPLFLAFFLLGPFASLSEPHLQPNGLVATACWVLIVVPLFIPLVLSYDSVKRAIVWLRTGSLTDLDAAEELQLPAGADHDASFVERHQSFRRGLSIISKASSSAGLDPTDFQTVRETPILFDAFQQFCVQSWCIENVKFYLDVQAYCQLSPEELKERSITLAEEYIKPGSPMEVNISHERRKAILDAVNTGAVNEATFNPAKEEVEHLIVKDIFPRFARSGIAVRLLKTQRMPSSGHSTLTASDRVRILNAAKDSDISLNLVNPLMHGGGNSDGHQSLRTSNLQTVLSVCELDDSTV
eukprot:Colp12_sorted_trinity150504_noHs@8241